MKAVLDKFGRVVIPKQVRDDLDLKPGEVLQVEKLEREIILKPLQNDSRIINKDGVLVVSGTATGNFIDAVRSHREKRLNKISL